MAGFTHQFFQNKTFLIKITSSNFTGLSGIGSTWYGATGLMVATAKTAIAAMRWMHTQEFTQFERCCSVTESWPFWHWPVLLLYGGHVAVNQLGPENVQLSKAGVAEMDHGTTSTGVLSDSIKHVHCWHTEEMFSKFAFTRGDYSKIDLTEYENMNSTRNYVTTVAISSDRLTAVEMKNYISNQTLMKENKWIRQLSMYLPENNVTGTNTALSEVTP